MSTRAGRIAAYLFDGTPGTGSPNTVAEVGGDTSLDLVIGSTAEYNVDSPFSGAGDTSLDVSGGLNERAENVATDVYEFDHQNQAWSVSMWIKGSVDSGAFTQIVGQRKQSTGNGWYVGLTSGGVATVFTQGQTPGQARGVSDTTYLFDGQWHYIVAVNDPASDLDGNGDGEILLYIDNGAPLNHKKVITESPPDYGNSVFSVGTGRDLGGTYNQFSGRVDEVGVFDHALTAQEVDFYFNNSVGAPIEVSYNTVAVTDAAIFEFESLLGFTYRLDRGTTLGPPDDFLPTGSFLEGNGSTMILADPSGPPTQHFYRIVIP
jgi:hypothetical protein